jgi:hypothetical protein
MSLQNVFAINFKLLVGYPKNKFQSNFGGNQKCMISSGPHVSTRAGVAPPDAFRNYSTLFSASILGLRTKSRLLLHFRHVPCNPIIFARSLPGNRRARSSFHRVSSAISGGPGILFRCGFILLSLHSRYPVGSKWSFEQIPAMSLPAHL